MVVVKSFKTEAGTRLVSAPFSIKDFPVSGSKTSNPGPASATEFARFSKLCSAIAGFTEVISNGIKIDMNIRRTAEAY